MGIKNQKKFPKQFEIMEYRNKIRKEIPKNVSIIRKWKLEIKRSSKLNMTYIFAGLFSKS